MGERGTEYLGVSGDCRGLWPKPFGAKALEEIEERSRRDGFPRLREGEIEEDGDISAERRMRYLVRHGEAGW